MSATSRTSKAYGILKLSELTFLIVSMGIFKGANLIFNGSHEVAIDTFFSGMFITGIVITTILFVCFLVGQTANLQQTFLESMVNMIMFIGLATVGGIAVSYLCSDASTFSKDNEIEGYAMVSTTWIASLIYLTDFVYSVIVYKK